MVTEIIYQDDFVIITKKNFTNYRIEGKHNTPAKNKIEAIKFCFKIHQNYCPIFKKERNRKWTVLVRLKKNKYLNI